MSNGKVVSTGRHDIVMSPCTTVDDITLWCGDRVLSRNDKKGLVSQGWLKVTLTLTDGSRLKGWSPPSRPRDAQREEKQ